MKLFLIVLSRKKAFDQPLEEIIRMIEWWEGEPLSASALSASALADAAAARLFLKRECEIRVERVGVMNLVYILVPDDVAVEAKLSIPDFEGQFFNDLDELAVAYPSCTPRNQLELKPLTTPNP